MRSTRTSWPAVVDVVADPERAQEVDGESLRLGVLLQRAAGEVMHSCTRFGGVVHPLLLRIEQVAHLEPELGDDLFHLAAGVTVDEHPPVLAFGDAQAGVAVVVGRTTPGATLLAACRLERLVDAVDRVVTVVVSAHRSIPLVAPDPAGLEAAW
jgi:hypothetical protein